MSERSELSPCIIYNNNVIYVVASFMINATLRDNVSDNYINFKLIIQFSLMYTGKYEYQALEEYLRLQT